MIYRTKSWHLRQRGLGGDYPVNNGDPQCDVDEPEEGFPDEPEPEEEDY
jgi:hypothetical protein